jgi:hypothetical protein
MQSLSSPLNFPHTPDPEGAPLDLERTMRPGEAIAQAQKTTYFLEVPLQPSPPPRAITPEPDWLFSAVHSPVKPEPPGQLNTELVTVINPYAVLSLSGGANGRGSPPSVLFTPDTVGHRRLIDSDRAANIRKRQNLVDSRNKTLMLLMQLIKNLDKATFNIEKIAEVAILASSCCECTNDIVQLQQRITEIERKLLVDLNILSEYYVQLENNIRHPAYVWFYTNERLNSKLLSVTKQILAKVYLSANNFKNSRPVSPAMRVVSPPVRNDEVMLNLDEVEEVLSVQYLFSESLKFFHAIFNNPTTKIEGKHIAIITNFTEICVLYLTQLKLNIEEYNLMSAQEHHLITKLHDSCARLTTHLDTISTPDTLIAEQYQTIYAKFTDDYMKIVVTVIEELQLFQTPTSGLQSIHKKGRLLLLARESQQITEKIESYDKDFGILGLTLVPTSNGMKSYRYLYVSEVVNILHWLISLTGELVETTVVAKQVFPLIAISHQVPEARLLTITKITAAFIIFSSHFRSLLCLHNTKIREQYMRNFVQIIGAFFAKLPHLYPDIAPAGYAFLSLWLQQDSSGTWSLSSHLEVDRSVPGVIMVGIRENGVWSGKRVEFHVGSACQDRNTASMEDFTVMLLTETDFASELNEQEEVQMIGLKNGEKYYYIGQITRYRDQSIRDPCPGGKFKFENNPEWQIVPSARQESRSKPNGFRSLRK